MLTTPRPNRTERLVDHADPTPTIRAWYAQARAAGPEHEQCVMTLATCGPDAQPAARIVVCKDIEPDPLALLFFTLDTTRKAAHLAANPRCAAVFHWPRSKRQARVEGLAAPLSDEENDACHAAMSIKERVGAGLIARPPGVGLVRYAIALAARSATNAGPPRPEHWRGHRITAHAVELWTARSPIDHDRARWVRDAHATAGWRADETGPPG